jgi:addiction module RelE/StbE family toxin
MKIVFKKSFVKQYTKLNRSKRDSVDTAIRIFEKNPLTPELMNHALKGKLQGKRAISAGFDLRIVFKVNGDYVLVEMLGAGSHNQVY